MKAESELVQKIMSITTLIKERHPELISFLEELPVTIPDVNDPQLNLKSLKEYYGSLCVILKKYEIEHPF